jgi:hypothetical protein
MGEALNGTWSNHSGFLAQALAEEMPDAVRVEPRARFLPVPVTAEGLQGLLEQDHAADLDGALSVHLWAHLWWETNRRDFSGVHAGLLTADYIRSVDTTYNRLARRFLPEVDLW